MLPHIKELLAQHGLGVYSVEGGGNYQPQEELDLSQLPETEYDDLLRAINFLTTTESPTAEGNYGYWTTPAPDQRIGNFQSYIVIKRDNPNYFPQT